MTKANHFFCSSGTPPRFHELLSSDLLFSDGVKTIVESTKCQWFLELIAKLQDEKKLNAHYFQNWELMRMSRSSFHIIVTDSLNHILVRHQVAAIDFTYDTATFWLVNNCIILPSEFVNCHMKTTALENTTHTSSFFVNNQN